MHAQAAATILANAREHRPDARIEGVLVSPMITGGVETIVGVMRDPIFGPVVMFGLGGIFVEVLKDVTFRVAPFDVDEAHRMIREIRGYAMLEGVRGAAPADVDALAEDAVATVALCSGKCGRHRQHRSQSGSGDAEGPRRLAARRADGVPG